jgi:outer membrane lipoprotein-sorting protein
MRRIGRFALLVTLATSNLVRADDPPKSDPEVVDRILAEWQAKTGAVTAVDVRFHLEERSAWDQIGSEGRAILVAPNRALVETRIIKPDGKVGELANRMIWNGQTILQFDPKENRVFRYKPRTEWSTAPEPLRLPFFFRMTVEEAKRDYDWSVREDKTQVALKARLKAKPRPFQMDEDRIILLDRETYLPKMLVLSSRDGKSSQRFRVLSLKVNPTEPLDDLLEPCLDAWTIVDRDDWLTRLFLK